MIKSMIAAGAAVLIGLGATGCARDEYRGGSWDDVDTGRLGSGRVATPDQVIITPSNVGGRRVRPAADSVSGAGTGPGTIPEGEIDRDPEPLLRDY